jgi:hypothetical protein
MLYTLVLRILTIVSPRGPTPLGRWGYHWDRYKDIQKYYD